MDDLSTPLIPKEPAMGRNETTARMQVCLGAEAHHGGHPCEPNPAPVDETDVGMPNWEAAWIDLGGEG